MTRTLRSLPLGEAACRLLRFIADEERLEALFQTHRGRCYQQLLTFAMVFRLTMDSLLSAGGSAYRVFSQAQEQGDLPASITAVYRKLGRMNIEVSMACVRELSDPLREIYPAAARRPAPASLQGLAIVVLDGKAIQNVAKRLKPLRGAKGGLLGGRALVALDYATGLVLAIQAEADGDANDARFTPWLLPQVRQRTEGPRLYIADRGFCDLNRFADFTAEGDHFLARYHCKNSFHRDPQRPARSGRDRQGRTYTEEWGWMGAPSHKLRRYVRWITLERAQEPSLILGADLLAADAYPADELLAMYLERWGIERVFPQVTENFGLKGLIGGTPQAAIFQFAFCLLLYNLLQTMRGFIAESANRDSESISIENVFADVRDELTAIAVWERRGVFDPAQLPRQSAAELSRCLRRIFQNEWSDRWIKSRNKTPRRPPPRSTQRTHNSVHRLLQAAKQRC
jgi:hypothetical protein